MCNNRNGVKGNVENLEESKSNSNVNLGEKIQAAEEGDRRNSGTKGEAHEALSAEKEFINGCFRENVLLRVLINESELVGGDPKGVSAVVDKKALKMNELIGGEGFESQQIEDDRSTLQKEKQKFGDLIRLRSIGGSAVLRSLAFVLLNGKVSNGNKGTREGDFIASRFKSERLAVLNRFWAAG
ncbi:hypothetical protein V6N11_081674 [Hibiscus sabdariffa]|uniref:Uncharacterized protein n=1 Tax=Hibiscus sabdariffa TaxID=183260 RepID=A0ABR1Z9N2_9ROSI